MFLQIPVIYLLLCVCVCNASSWLHSNLVIFWTLKYSQSDLVSRLVVSCNFVSGHSGFPCLKEKL